MIVLYWRIWQETQKRYKDLTTLFLVSTGKASMMPQLKRSIFINRASWFVLNGAKEGGTIKSIRGKPEAVRNQSSSASSSLAAPGLVCLTRNSTFSSSEEVCIRFAVTQKEQTIK
jgi:hypothetical protein